MYVLLRKNMNNIFFSVLVFMFVYEYICMYVDTSNHHTYLTHTVYAMQLTNDDASQFLACPGVHPGFFGWQSAGMLHAGWC